MLNRVVIVGRLTRDPDLRYTPSGLPVANFTVAANRPFKNQQGEQEADFINCVIWRKPAESLATYMKKGGLVGVEGRIQTRSYENQEGKMVYVTEVLAETVQFLESRSSAGQRDSGGSYSNNQAVAEPNYGEQGRGNVAQQQQQAPTTDSYQKPFNDERQQIDISDDDLPF